jgi:uncharacterized membrane protein (DUF106 family)
MMNVTPFMTITLLSLGLSFSISVLYRFLTNPAEVRKAKEDMKFFREKVKEAQKSGDKQKIAEYSSEMLKASQGQFRMSMKPMVASMLVFVFLLGWLNANFGGITIDAEKDPEAAFSYGGADLGVMVSSVGDDGQAISASVDLDGDGTFSADERFAEGDIFEYGGAYWRLGPATQGYLFFASRVEGAVHFEMLIARMPFNMPFLGSYLSWLWWYIFLSIPSTLIFRKILGVE